MSELILLDLIEREALLKVQFYFERFDVFFTSLKDLKNPELFPGKRDGPTKVFFEKLNQVIGNRRHDLKKCGISWKKVINEFKKKLE